MTYIVLGVCGGGRGSGGFVVVTKKARENSVKNFGVLIAAVVLFFVVVYLSVSHPP